MVWWDEENIVRARGRALDPEITGFADRAFELLAEGQDLTQGMYFPHAWESAMTLAAAQTLNTLKLAWEAAFDGYYVQSLALQRTATEYLGLMWYFPKHRDEAYKWLRFGDKPPLTGGEVLKVVFKDDPATSEKVFDLRQELGRFVHQDTLALGLNYDDSQAGQGRMMVWVGPFTDVRSFRGAAYGLIVLTTLLLHSFSMWLEREHRVDRTWLAKTVIYLNEGMAWVKDYKVEGEPTPASS